MYSSKISKKGQIVIPQEIRERLKIQPGDRLRIIDSGNRIYIEKEDSEDTLPRLTDILKKGKPFPPKLIHTLREEWE